MISKVQSLRFCALGAVLLSLVGTAVAQNTEFGTGALTSNTSGTYNSAFGFFALHSNTLGSQNTAGGALALLNNTVGSWNTAIGLYALVSNTVGFENTALGGDALGANNTGFQNTATGTFSLSSNTAGTYNTADGYAALTSNESDGNTASGAYALQSTTSGFNNTAIGEFALTNNTTSNSNIAIGGFAGSNIFAGERNIEIGTSSPTDESGVIRIGTEGLQTSAYIAGISSTMVTGTAVEVASNGQLGIAPSSARYKRDIRDMGNASAGLMKLRPVSFRYKDDPASTLQYGLVAEEVQRVYPQLVTRGNDGKAQSVRYLEFTALLLNELQRQSDELTTQGRQMRELAKQLDAKNQRVVVQQREIDALEHSAATIKLLAERLSSVEREINQADPRRLGLVAKR